MLHHIKRRFYSIFKKGLKDERGAIALIFGIVLTMFLGAADTIVEHTKVAELNTRLQAIADEASGRALKEYSATGDIKAARHAANNYIEQQRVILRDEKKGALQSSGADITIKEVKIIPKPLPEAHVHLLSQIPGRVLVFFQKTHYLESRSTSGVADVNTEIAVVLDISGTMRDYNRMRRAKTALDRFGVRIFTTLKSKVNKVAMSLVPYAGSVHFGNEYWHFGGIWRNPNSPITRKNWNGCFDYWSPASRGWRDDGSILTSPLERMARVKTNDRYPWCPRAENKILPFAQTAGQFTGALKGLTFGDGTSTDTGMAWGFRLLSEHWRSRFRGKNSGTFPLKYTDKNKKHMILLTDGMINVYHSDYSDQQAENNFLKTCENIANRGITMHIIGYDIGSRAREQLKKCVEYGTFAGSQFYEAIPSTIDTVFDKILAKAVPTRIVQ